MQNVKFILQQIYVIGKDNFNITRDAILDKMESNSKSFSHHVNKSAFGANLSFPNTMYMYIQSKRLKIKVVAVSRSPS